MQEKIEGIPDGYKIKRFGRVNTGEVYMNSNSEIRIWNSDRTSMSFYLILEKIKVRRQITPQDCVNGPVKVIFVSPENRSEKEIEIIGFMHLDIFRFYNKEGYAYTNQCLFIEE